LRDTEEALDVSTTTIGDYSPTSVGNVKRMDGVIQWIQNRATAIDSVIARPFGLENTPGTVVLNKAVDGTRWWLWETYRFASRLGGELVDEKLLNSLEDGVDKNLNRFRLQPAEVVAPGGSQPIAAPPAPAQEGRPTTIPPPAPPAAPPTVPATHAGLSGE
jgi:hypothetical protein